MGLLTQGPPYQPWEYIWVCAYYGLKKLGYSYKKKSFTWSEEKRDTYTKVIKEIPPERLVYIDESGIEMTMCKDRGWGKKAKPLLGKKVGSIIKKRILSLALIKELKPGQVAVMDNASFHTSEKTKDLLVSVSCTLIFLPPYSPDLNPIEQFWANMKHWIKHKTEDIGQ